MLQPKRVKYRRPQDGRGRKGDAHRGTTLAFGSFGIKALERKWITAQQIEAARIAVTRYMNVKVRFGFVFSRTNLSLVSLLMCVWVKVRVIQQDGLHLLLLVESLLKPKAYLSILQRKLCAWLLRNCLSQQSLL